MAYRVFSQTRLERAALLGAAQRTRGSVEVLEPIEPGGLRIRVHSQGPVVLRITERPRTAADLEDARNAEHASRATGMADLAARCPHVWELTSDDATAIPEPAALEACAVLAFAALGPVLPPDGSALFGVRGARERAERLTR